MSEERTVLFFESESREIQVDGARWGIAIWSGQGWAIYKATPEGFDFIRFIRHCAPEEIQKIIKDLENAARVLGESDAEEVNRRG